MGIRSLGPFAVETARYVRCLPKGVALGWRRQIRKRRSKRAPGQLPQPLRWRPRVRIFGVFTGAIGGLGTVILAQQYGVAVLTRAFTLQGFVGGALSGFVIPSGIFAVVVLVHNRRLGRLRGRLSAGAGTRMMLWVLLGILGAALLLTSPEARAEMSGPCLAIINGQDVRELSAHPDDAIQLDPEGTATITVAAPRDFSHIAAGVRWAGQEFSIDEAGETDPDDEEEGGSFTGTVAVSDIAWLGGGIYEVYGSGTLTDGSVCAWDFLINVGQDPLETLMGMAAAGASAIGAVGAIGVSVSSLLEGREHLRDLASVVVDVDGDGIADATAFDTNADGQIDTLGFDTDGDGLIDQIAVDTDGDGVFDTAYDSSGVLEPPEIESVPTEGTETVSESSVGGTDMDASTEANVDATDGDASAKAGPEELDSGADNAPREPAETANPPASSAVPSGASPDPGSGSASVTVSDTAASTVPVPPAGAESSVPSGWEGGLGAGGPTDNPFTGFDGGGGPGVCMLTGGLPNYWVSLVNRSLVVSDRIYGFTAPNGEVVFQLTYNSTDALASGQFGAGWSFSYEERLVPSGRRVYVRNGSGHVTSYPVGDTVVRTGDSWLVVDGEIGKRFIEISGDFVLAEIRSPSGVLVSISYDDTARIVGLSDRAGRNVTFSHNSDGRCTGFRLPDGREALFEYRADRLVRVTDLAGIATDYEYDESGLLVALSVAEGHSSAGFAYEARAVTAVTDAGGHVTNYRAIAEDTVEMVDPAGRRALYRSDNGRTVEIADDHGKVASYRYEDGLLSEVITPSMASRFQYDRGRLVREETNGHTTEYAYDGAGELAEVRAPAGTSVYTREPVGGFGVTTPGGDRLSVTWDDEGRIATVDGVARFSYDRFGNVANDTNGGDAVRYEWDEWGFRLTSVHHPEHGTTTFRYDGNDRPTEIIGPDGAVTAIEYGCCAAMKVRDPEGEVFTLRRDPMLGITGTELDGRRLSAAEFDSGGRTIGRTDGAGRRTGFRYDSTGRLVGVELPGGEELAVRYHERTVTKITDPLGRRMVFDVIGEQASLTQPSGRRLTVTRDVARGELRVRNARDQDVILRLDLDGRLLEVDSGVRQGGGFRYDESGRLAEEVSLAYTVSYEYDGAGRLSQMHWSNGPSLRVSGEEWIYPSGLRIRHRRGSGDSATTEWDENSVTLRRSGNDLEIDRSNGWTSHTALDSLGRILSLRDSSEKQTLLDVSYERDQVGRVIAESGTAPASPAPDSPRMSFDSVDRLTGVGDLRCAHDADDNLTAIGDEWRATYDAAGRLVRYIGVMGEVLLVWDARGRRIAKKDGSDLTTFHFDPFGRLLCESKDGEVVAEYVYVGMTPVARVSGGNTTFFHFDGLGNLVGTSDSVGSLTGIFSYGPWGEHLGSTPPGPFTWQGKYGVIDESDGVYTIGSRTYLALTGRFCQPDPIGWDGGLNLYAFSGGDPINGVDLAGTEGTWKWLRDDFDESLEIVSGWARRAGSAIKGGLEWVRDTALPNTQDYVQRQAGALNESYNPLHHAFNKDLPKVQVGPSRSVEENLRNFGDVEAIQTRYRQTAARAARDSLTSSSPGAQVDGLINTTRNLAEGKYGEAAEDLANRALDTVPLSDGIARAKDRLERMRELRDKADLARKVRDITTGCGGR